MEVPKLCGVKPPHPAKIKGDDALISKLIFSTKNAPSIQKGLACVTVGDNYKI